MKLLSSRQSRVDKMAFIEITEAAFCQQSLYDRLHHDGHGAGAIVTFTGLVRDFNHNGQIDGIELEHYPGMAEAIFQRLLNEAIARFDLLNAGAVHRVGRLQNFDPIVWVGTTASHRKAAFDAANFIMDSLKKDVPIWKKEWAQGKSEWVAVKASDQAAAKRWQSE